MNDCGCITAPGPVARPSRWLAMGLLAVASVVQGAPLSSDLKSGWVALDAVPGEQHSYAVARLPSGEIVISGGFERGENGETRFSARVQVYDIRTRGWSELPQLPQSRYSHSMVALADGDLLVCGGGDAMNEVLRYRQAQRQWQSVAPMQRARIDATTVTLADGRVLVAGGIGRRDRQEASVSNWAEIYDPQTDRWEYTGPVHALRLRSFSLTLLRDGQVLLAGGEEIGDSDHPYLASSERYDPASNRWIASASMHRGREGHSAAMLTDGRVLVTGGNTGDPDLSSRHTAELYDPVTDQWREAAPMLAARRLHASARLEDGRILVTGGAEGNATDPTEPNDTAEVYDPALDRWSTAPMMSSPRYFHSAWTLPDHQILLLGGGRTQQRSALQPDLLMALAPKAASGLWRSAASMSQPRVFHAAARLRNGQVLVTGGGPDGSDMSVSSTDSERYDPRTDRWQAAAPMHQTRMGHTATVLRDGQVLVVGGLSGGRSLASVELYDPGKDRWTELDELSLARHAHTATLLNDGRVLLVGGLGMARMGPMSPDPSVLLFDPGTRAWSTRASVFETDEYGLPGVPNGHTATLLDDGRVLITGGSNAQVTQSNETWIYDPRSDRWESGPPMRQSRAQHSALRLSDGRVLVSGGSDERFDEGHFDEIFDPRTGQWRDADTRMATCTQNALELLSDGRVLIGPGVCTNGASTPAYAWLYDPAMDSARMIWMGRDQRFPRSVMLRDGRVLITGGLDDDNQLMADSLIYYPSPD